MEAAPNLDALRTAIDGDRRRLCAALGLRADNGRYFCPRCQNDGHPHADGDFSIEAGFKCHRCGWSGDGLRLVRLVKSCDFRDAVVFAGNVYGIGGEDLGHGIKRTMLEPNPMTTPARKTHPTIDGAAKAAAWGLEKTTGQKWTETRRDVYRDAGGRDVAAVIRFDRADGATDAQGKPIKTFRPVHAVADGWRTGDPPGEWPLFRLPELLASAGAVYVNEGEKKSCAGAEIGLTCTASAHGANSPAKTDWSRLAGRDVVILPDHDRSGRGYADTVAGLAHAAGARSVRIVELPGLPPKGDLADFIALRTGQTPEAIRREVERVAASAPVLEQPPTSSTVTESSGLDRRTKAEKSSSWFILPSGEVSITESARQVFAAIGPTHTLFTRARRVMEIVPAEDGTPALDLVTADDFRSRLERYGRTVGAFRADHNNPGEYVLKEVTCSKDMAGALLETLDARELLPPIQSVVAAPIITETDGQLVTLGRGYHSHNGGVLITRGETVPEVDTDEAIRALFDVLADYDFQSEGDRSRAAASFITPALRLGGFIREDIPLDIAEADKSQSGKTYRQKLVCAVYGERPYVVTRREGGVGSLDESLCQALVAGRPFIMLENIRGRIDSQILESALRGMGYVTARIPHKGEIQVDTRRFMFQLTSNGVETTRDLANRSAIVRIRKRPMDYQFRHWPEGDLFDHITKNQAYYLGCVFAIVRAWHAAGKPSTQETRHDFRQWTRTLDWIVCEVLGMAPLMDGHPAAQERVSNPALTWLRSVALAAETDNALSQDLSASRLYELGEEHGIEIPGLRGEPDEQTAPQHIGRIMAKLFREAEALDVDGFTVTRQERDEYFAESRVTKPVKFYTFTREAAE